MAKNATNAAPAAATGAMVPAGQKLGRAAGPGNLFPGAGALARQSGQPIFCGRIAGQVFTFTEHPNSKDPSKKSVRFAGRFLFIDHDGKQSMHSEAYLPGVVGNGLRASLELARQNSIGGMASGPLTIALEVWCEPDQFTQRRSAIGYEYAVYDRSAPAEGIDPVQQIAIAAGLIPAPALPAPSEPAGDVDPATGEIIHPGSRAA